MPTLAAVPPPDARPAAWRSIAGPALVAATVVLALYVLARLTQAHLQARGIATGFGFLSQPATFSIAESWISFVPGRDSYARALAAGAINTAFVSTLVIVLATVLGAALGLARLSPNWLLSRSAGAYVELMRNVPLPLHLLLWYQVLLNLPVPRQALRWGEWLVLSNRGLWLPAPGWRDGGPVLDLPVLRGFNFEGGLMLSPELAALTVALTLYSAAFVGEIVRAGILSVPRGQWQAAQSLGLSRRDVLRWVVMPLSLRLVVPPLAGEYLNTVKNSSLAVVIGYPEITSLINTMLSETGRPIEAVALLMLAYLTISVPVALFMNWYNRRVALPAR